MRTTGRQSIRVLRLGSDLSSANRLLFREYPYATVRVVIFLKANGVAARLLMNGGGLVGIATVSLSKIYCGVRHGLGLRRKKNRLAAIIRLAVAPKRICPLVSVSARRLGIWL